MTHASSTAASAPGADRGCLSNPGRSRSPTRPSSRTAHLATSSRLVGDIQRAPGSRATFAGPRARRAAKPRPSRGHPDRRPPRPSLASRGRQLAAASAATAIGEPLHRATAGPRSAGYSSSSASIRRSARRRPSDRPRRGDLLDEGSLTNVRRSRAVIRPIRRWARSSPHLRPAVVAVERGAADLRVRHPVAEDLRPGAAFDRQRDEPGPWSRTARGSASRTPAVFLAPPLAGVVVAAVLAAGTRAPRGRARGPERGARTVCRPRHPRCPEPAVDRDARLRAGSTRLRAGSVRAAWNRSCLLA